jgi:hypothetical protein
VDNVYNARKKFELHFSSLQQSLAKFANTPKKTILEKSKKNEILASSEILFLFMVDTYKTNKK